MSELIPGEYDVRLNGVDIHYTVRGSGPSGHAASDAYLLPDYAADLEALRNHLGLAKHIPNVCLEIFEDSGHIALVEEPEKFYRVIKEFVES